MKNSKTILLLTVVVAVLVLGVAYAALTQDLTITANATVAPDASNFNVAFNGATVKKIQTLGVDATTANAAKVTTSANGVTTASLVIAEGALKKVDDYVEVEYTVKNSSKDLIANLGNVTVTPGNNSKYVTFTADYKDADAKSLAVQTGTTVIVVRATLIKSPAAADDSSITATATISFTATAAEA